MITTNGSKILGYSLSGKNVNTKSGLIWLTSSVINVDGENYDGPAFNPLTYLKYASADNLSKIQDNSQYMGITMNLGLGDTEPTSEDYWLDDTDLNGVDVNTVVRIQGTKGTFENDVYGNPMYSFIFKNVGQSAVTIREIGLSYLDSRGKFLIARKLIPPRTIEQGETATFTYTISLLNGST